jgi:LacI family transcriptional regulator
MPDIIKNRQEAVRVTLSSVAAMAGVSTMTVSRALREDPKLPAGTRKRIQAVAQSVGYRPDPMISQLMGQLKSSRMRAPEPLAWLIPRAIPPGWRDAFTVRECFDGAGKRAAQLGYKLDVIPTYDPSIGPKRLTQILLARSITGVLVAATPGLPLAVEFDWDHFSIATCGHTVSAPSVCRACNHHQRIIRTALAELVRAGYRRPGLVITQTDNLRVDDGWTAGFLSYQLHLPVKDRTPVLMDEPVSGRQIVRWLDRHRPDVVLSHSMDDLDIIRSSGRCVPGDIGFVHLDLERGNSRCAGMRQNHADVGASAVEMVVAQIHRGERGIPTVPKLILTDGTWVPGPSIRIATTPGGAGKKRRKQPV